MAPRRETKRPNVYGISREVWDHEAFAKEPYTEVQAWVWLIGAAAWKETRVRGNGIPLSIKRSEFSFSVRFLAEKFQWSKSRVDRFLRMLENRDIVRDTSRDGSKVYFINNYNNYQIVGIPKNSENGTVRGTKLGHERDKEETGETGETEEDSPSLFDIPSDFEVWYAAYPRRIDRKDAERAYAKALTKIAPPVLLAATKTFATSVQFKDAKFIPHPATWLNKERWAAESPPAGQPSPLAAFEARVRAIMGDEANRHLANFQLTFGANLERAAEKLEEFAGAARPAVAASEYFFAHGAPGCTVGTMH